MIDDREVVVIFKADAMALAQHLGDPVGNGIHIVLTVDLHIDDRDDQFTANRPGVEKAGLSRADGDHHHVVFITHHAAASFLQHANDLERDIVELDGLADRILILFK